MLLRKLHSMNVLNSLLMIHLGHIALLADKVNKKTAGDQDSREKQKLADG